MSNSNSAGNTGAIAAAERTAERKLQAAKDAVDRIALDMRRLLPALAEYLQAALRVAVLLTAAGRPEDATQWAQELSRLGERVGTLGPEFGNLAEQWDTLTRPLRAARPPDPDASMPAPVLMPLSPASHRPN